MSQLFVKDNSGSKVQAVELASITGKQQMVFGGGAQDLILRTAGNVSVQVGNKLYPLTFSTATTTSTNITGSTTTILALDSDLKDLTYPGDGNYVFIQQSKSFFIASGNSYIQLSLNTLSSTLSGTVVGNSTGFLSYVTPQTLTGAQLLQLTLNSGNINSFSDISGYTKTNIYPNQLLYSIADQSHYVLTTPASPSLQTSWQPLYLSLINGGNVLKPVSITVDGTSIQTNSALHITGDSPNIFTIPTIPTSLFTIGAADYTSGLATWTNSGNVFFRLLNTNPQSTFNFITSSSTPLIVSNNNVAINTNISYKYNLNIGGTVMLNGSFTQTGNTQSSNFLQGQSGFAITKDSSNLWTLEIDNVIVREQLTINPTYQTKGLDGAQLFAPDIIITNIDFIETFPIYMNASASGQFSDNIGTVRPLSSRATNANVIHIPIANLNTNSPTQAYEVIPLTYGIGDIYNDLTTDTSTTYNQASDLSYYTPTGTTQYDSGTNTFIAGTQLLQINSISVYFMQTQSTLIIGDLLYYKMWDYDSNYLGTIRAEVVLVVSDGYFIYVYDGGGVNIGTKLVRIGNTNGTKSFLQTNSSEDLSPFIELTSNITTFNNFVSNYYYEQDTDNPSFNFIENDWTNPLNTRFKVGDLSNMIGSTLAISLGLTTQQYGLYSDNAYIKGNFIVDNPTTFLGYIPANDNNVVHLTGYPTQTVDGNLIVGSTNLGGVSITGFNTTVAGKVLIGWNRSNGGGETNFINTPGTTASIGGFTFSIIDNSSVETQLLYLNGSTAAATFGGRIVPGIVDPYSSTATLYLTLDAITGEIVSRTTSQVLSDIGGSGGGTSNYIALETPSGSVNGSNTAFTLSTTPVSGSETIVLNGLVQTPSTDYTMSGGIVTFSIAPFVGDIIRVTYLGVGSTMTTYVALEAPSGTINSSNTVFTLIHTPVVLAETVYLNGLTQIRSVDYNLSGTTITFITAPFTGDTILVTYLY